MQSHWYGAKNTVLSELRGILPHPKPLGSLNLSKVFFHLLTIGKLTKAESSINYICTYIYICFINSVILWWPIHDLYKYYPATRGQNPGHVNFIGESLRDPFDEGVSHQHPVTPGEHSKPSIEQGKKQWKVRAPWLFRLFFGGYTTLCYNAIIGIFTAFHYTDCFFLEPMAYCLVFQVPCEDRCERTPKHLLRQGLWGVQTLPHQVFGGFWKTRDHNLLKTGQK